MRVPWRGIASELRAALLRVKTLDGGGGAHGGHGEGEGAEAAPKLRRVLRRWDLLAFGVGGILGAGIYVLTGEVARFVTGPAVVLSFALSGAACIFSALSYAEFGSRAAGRVGSAGSAYSYAYAVFGEVANWAARAARSRLSRAQVLAWVLGWDLVLEYAVSAAAVSRGWSGYLSGLLRDAGWGDLPAFLRAAPPGVGAISPDPLAGMLVLLVAALLCAGVRESAAAQGAATALNVACLCLVVAVGATKVEAANFSPFVPPEMGLTGVFRGAAVLFFAYIGFDSVSVVAEESQRPEVDIPFCILASLGVVAGLYVAVALVVVGMVRYSALDVAAPLAAGFRLRGPAWAALAVDVGALLGLFTVTVSSLVPQSRIFLAMARDGLLPPVFARVHPRLKTPVHGTLIIGFFVALLAALFDLEVLAQAVSIGTLFAFTVVCGGVLVLRMEPLPVLFVVGVPVRPAGVVAVYACGLVGGYAAASDPALALPLRILGGLLGGAIAALAAAAAVRALRVPPACSFPCPGYPYVPLAGMAVNTYMMVHLGAAAWLRLAAWFALGAALYLSYGIRRSALRRRPEPAAGLSELRAALLQGAAGVESPGYDSEEVVELRTSLEVDDFLKALHHPRPRPAPEGPGSPPGQRLRPSSGGSRGGGSSSWREAAAAAAPASP